MSFYKIRDTELKSVADALRTKLGNQDKIVWPDGYIDSITNLSSIATTFAFVICKYFPGNTISATDGTIILTNDRYVSKSGDCVFAIPHSGTWTFSSPTYSTDLNVTTEGHIYTVYLRPLQYSNQNNISLNIDSSMYKDGDWCAITSGPVSLVDNAVRFPKDTYGCVEFYYIPPQDRHSYTIYGVCKVYESHAGDLFVLGSPYAEWSLDNPHFFVRGSRLFGSVFLESRNLDLHVDMSNYHVLAMTIDSANGKVCGYVDGVIKYYNEICLHNGPSVYINGSIDGARSAATDWKYFGIVSGVDNNVTRNSLDLKKRYIEV